MNQIIKNLDTKYLWAILDQGFYSVSNFFLNITLARFLLEVEYGAFAFSYSIFLFLILIHTALIAEPMMVFGGRSFKKSINQYFYILIKYQIIFSVIFVILFIVLSLILLNNENNYLAEAFFGITASLTFILLFYLYRKYCYVIDRIQVAAYSGLVYLVSIVVGIFFLFNSNNLTLFTSFLLMALSAALATFFMHLYMKIPFFKAVEKIQYRNVAKKHYEYGKWALGTGVLIWFPSNIYYFVLPYSDSLEVNASFKALMNLVMPLIQTNIALSNVLLPGLARIQNQEEFFNYLKIFTYLVSFCCLIYWLIIGIGSNTILQLLYNGKYSTTNSTFWLLGSIPLLSWLALSARSALKANERPDLVFWSNLISTIVCITIGVYLAFFYGVVGAIVGMGISYFLMYIMLLFYIKKIKKDWLVR